RWCTGEQKVIALTSLESGKYPFPLSRNLFFWVPTLLAFFFSRNPVFSFSRLTWGGPRRHTRGTYYERWCIFEDSHRARKRWWGQDPGSCASCLCPVISCPGYVTCRPRCSGYGQPAPLRTSLQGSATNCLSCSGRVKSC